MRSKARRDERTARGLAPSPIKVTVTERVELDACADFFTTARHQEARLLREPAGGRRPLATRTVATVVDGGQPVEMRRISEDLGAAVPDQLTEETDAAPTAHCDDPHPGVGAGAVRRRHATAARVFSFDGRVDGQENVAFGLGDRAAAVTSGGRGPAPLVRPHSEWLTGDVFGSQRCDCGPAQREAVERIADSGGALLYLRQAHKMGRRLSPLRFEHTPMLIAGAYDAAKAVLEQLEIDGASTACPPTTDRCGLIERVRGQRGDADGERGPSKVTQSAGPSRSEWSGRGRAPVPHS